MKHHHILNSKITSGFLNIGLIAGIVLNVGGHAVRFMTDGRYGYSSVIGGYGLLAAAYFGICLRAYIRQGNIDQRRWSWIILILISPPLFATSERSDSEVVSAVILAGLALIIAVGTITEINYQRSLK